jgi:hypothetical protein
MVSAWLWKSPWAKLIRATSMPAAIIRPSTSRDCEAGPMVQTILVLTASLSTMACPFCAVTADSTS